MMHRILVSLFVLCIALVGRPALSADEAGGPMISPRVRKVMMAASRYLKSAQRFTFRIESTSEVVLESGQKIQYSGASDVAVRRPDRLQANARGAAILAGVALGVTTFEQAAEQIEVAREYQPNPANRQIYDELFDIFLNIYKKNRKIYARLNKKH